MKFVIFTLLAIVGPQFFIDYTLEHRIHNLEEQVHTLKRVIDEHEMQRADPIHTYFGDDGAAYKSLNSKNAGYKP